MAYDRAHVDLGGSSGPVGLAEKLGLKNIGLSVHVFARGEGFDFFHNHREQEEVYFCLEGGADLKIGTKGDEVVHLERGDVIRVDAATQRAIGNLSSERAVVLIAGACPHPYPAGFGHHEVIADVLSMSPKGVTGFRLPSYVRTSAPAQNDDDC